MTNQRGQSTLEYLLVLVAILLALFIGVRPTGPIQSAVGTMLSSSQTVIGQAVSNAQRRLGL